MIHKIIERLLHKTKAGKIKWSKTEEAGVYRFQDWGYQIIVFEHESIRICDNTALVLGELDDVKVVGPLYLAARFSSGIDADLDKLLELLTEDKNDGSK